MLFRAITTILISMSAVVAVAGEVHCPPSDRPPEIDDMTSEGCIVELGWFPHAYLSSGTGVPLSALENKLGPASRTWSGPDRFKGEEIQTFREFITDDVRVIASQWGGSDSLGIEEFHLTAPGPKLPCGLALGQSRSEVVAKLGPRARVRELEKASEVLASSIRHWCEENKGHVFHMVSRCGVRLLFGEDKTLREVSWEYGAD